MTGLNDLVGLHVLTAVDMDTNSLPESMRGEVWDGANVINFELDGVTYAVIEDPEDGYRSSMQEIITVAYSISNRFEPCKVECKMRENGGDVVLDMYDVVTGNVVLSVGTWSEYEDDYYPYFVAEFTPENMASNTQRKVSQ